MGGGGSSGGGTTNTTTTQKADPWWGIQPALLQVAAGVNQLQPRTFYPGQTVFDYSQPSQQYIGALETLGTQGSPEYNAASTYLQNELGGAYLGSNPYADAAFGSGANAVTGAVSSAMARSGRGLNTGANQSLLTTQLGDLANQFYFNNYATERANQNAALGYAPTVQQMGYQDLSGLQTAGQALEAKQYETAQDQQNRYNFAQNEPYQYLSDKASILQGTGGNYGTQTSTGASTAPGVKTDTTSQIIGGIASVAGIAAMAFSSRTLKTRHGAVKPKDALEKIRKLPVDRWIYIGGIGDSNPHIGTYAEDFNKAFDTGHEHPGMISMIDMHGAEMAAIQELANKVARLEKRKGS